MKPTVVKWGRWLLQAILMIILMLALLGLMRYVWSGPKDIECHALGGHRVQYVSAFLCVDEHGHVIELE